MSPSSASHLKILNTEPNRYSEFCRAELRTLGIVTEEECDRETLLKLIGDFDVVLTVLKNTFDFEVLSSAKKLKLIATPTTGLNHIDLDFAAERKIQVLSLKGEGEFLDGVSATAELAWGLLLGLIRQIPQACQSVEGGEWSRNRFMGNELKGKTLGILGCGRLGTKVARYGVAFGMNVIACDPYIPQAPEHVSLVSAHELFSNSDIVSVHLPLNSETKGMLGSQALSRFKQGAFLINTARGEIIDEKALLTELKSGRIAGAAVDVLANEFSTDPNWLSENELFQYAQKHPNILMTPHIGGVTKESFEATNRFIIQKLKSNLIAQKAFSE